MQNIFVFDIETIPDVDSGRRLYALDGLDDADTGKAMLALRQQQTGNDFLPLHLHRICAISVVLRHADKVRVWTLGEADAPEAELVQRFYDGIDKFTPTLVSWNGGDNRDFKWNNYLSRYHERHTDLMDVLANYQPRASAKLDEIASMLGFPGKMGMSGAKVWDACQAGEIGRIRDYCETDVLNTYLVYLRFELIRGHLTAAAYQREFDLLRNSLQADDRAHIGEFLEHWSDDRSG